MLWDMSSFSKFEIEFGSENDTIIPQQFVIIL